MIKYPKNENYIISREDIWKILIFIEMQGGDKTFAYKSNRIFEKVVEEGDK